VKVAAGDASMRQKTLLLAVLCIAAVIATAVVAQRRAGKESAPQLPEEGHFVSGLSNLWKETAVKDRGPISRLFTPLAALARKPLNAIIPGVRPDEVSIATFQGGHDNYVVVNLRGWDHSIPGDDTQHLVLLDHEGRCLDRLSCSINARLTRLYVHHKGIFPTEVPKTPEKDGARLVIRYIPEDGGNLYGNWSHEIAHGGRASSYAWPKDKLEGIGPGEWDRKGLCRVAIRDGKFVRLFP
jgi:hypothetical protein